MNNTIISRKVYVESINQRFNELKHHICGKFRFCLNNIGCWLKLLSTGQLDKSTTIIAFESIEYHALKESILLDELINWCLPSEIYSQLPNIDDTRRRFEEFKLPLCADIRFTINNIICWLNCLRCNQLDKTTITQAFEMMRHNTREQNQLIEKFQNWSLF